jgi:hypothetical protein
MLKKRFRLVYYLNEEEIRGDVCLIKIIHGIFISKL